MSDSKISDAAVEAARRSLYFSASPEATEADYIEDRVQDEGAEDVTAWTRAALAAALPHLHLQPADLSEQHGDALVASLVQVMNAEYDGLGRLPADVLGVLNMAVEALAATGKQQVGDGPDRYHPAQRMADIEGRIEPSARELEGLHDEQVGEVHPDDVAVDAFAAAMKLKMADARAKGRGGWEDPAQCSVLDLSRLLRAHVEKGDPRDVANFCMMLWNRGEGIAAHQLAQVPMGYLFTDDPAKFAMPGGGFHPGAEPPADAINVVPVYTRTPAQGIDLGQFREAVVQWKLAAERVIRCKGHAMAEEKVKVRDEAVRLLALIDGQRDAAPGVGNG